MSSPTRPTPVGQSESTLLLDVHCRRKAALTAEIAMRLGLDDEPTGSPKLAGVLEAAGLFEQRLSFLPYETVSAAQIRRELTDLAASRFLAPEVVRAILNLQMLDETKIARIARQLPVYPAATLQAFTLSADVDVSFERLQQVISMDQVLAGHIIEAANSALHARQFPASSIRQAIAALGLDLTRKLIAAVALRPLAVSTNLRTLWRHSLEMAQRVEALARVSNTTTPVEAFLAGLIHDVGRLVLERVPLEVALSQARMREAGCEPVFIEHVLCGFDHGYVGAQVLQIWRFPSQIIEAVRFHHQPECTSSAMASLLYLAEHVASSEEDTPSGVRIDAALDCARLTLDQMRSASTTNERDLEILARCA